MTVNDSIVRVYVAGPLFGSGRSTENVNRALQVGQAVMAAGAVPFVPHLFHLWDTVFPHDSDYWLYMDKHWLRACDLLVVIPGVSPGARMEEEWAKEFGIPVVLLNELSTPSEKEHPGIATHAQILRMIRRMVRVIKERKEARGET